MLKRILYRNYRLSSSVRDRFKRRLTAPGFVLLAATLVCGALGSDTNAAMAFHGFALGASLFLVAWFWMWLPNPVISVRRTLPRFGTAGQPLEYRVTLSTPSSRILRGLAAFELLADPRPSLEEFLEGREPGELKRNAFDRAFGFYRWLWLISQKQIAVASEFLIPPFVKGQPVEVRMNLIPSKRGRLALEGLAVACPDPFGLLRRVVRTPLAESVLILPKRYPLPNLDLPGRRQYQQGGVTLASTVGESEEFASLRDYRAGDSPRRIHWKSLAKTGRLIVKEFQDEFFVRHALILDTFLSRDNSELFEEAVSVAASFACAIPTQDSLLDLMFVGPKAFCFTTGRGLAQTGQMLEILAAVRPCTEKPFHSLRTLVQSHITAVSGCVCVLLGWDDARQDLVRQLQVFNVPILVVVLVSRGETIAENPLAPQVEAFHVIELGAVGEGLARL